MSAERISFRASFSKAESCTARRTWPCRCVRVFHHARGRMTANQWSAALPATASQASRRCLPNCGSASRHGRCHPVSVVPDGGLNFGRTQRPVGPFASPVLVGFRGVVILDRPTAPAVSMTGVSLDFIGSSEAVVKSPRNQTRARFSGIRNGCVWFSNCRDIDALRLAERTASSGGGTDGWQLG